MKLPRFRYHPDPVATGSVVESAATCACCRRTRGWIYDGPTYSAQHIKPAICPWCIANGEAHERLDVEFSDKELVGGGGEWGSVRAAVIEEIAWRTPGFSGWQQERWWTHCGDGAQYLGRAGARELLALGPVAMAAIRASTGLAEGPAWDAFFRALDKDGSPVSYVFRCAICGVYGGYQDCD
jgi:uncharacterized protein CbrC (UPF0167 family)